MPMVIYASSDIADKPIVVVDTIFINEAGIWGIPARVILDMKPHTAFKIVFPERMYKKKEDVKDKIRAVASGYNKRYAPGIWVVRSLQNEDGFRDFLFIRLHDRNGDSVGFR